MRRHTNLGRWTALLCFAILSPAANLSADETEPTTAIRQHLAAGEFSSAISLVQQMPVASRRDAILGEIAQAQAAAGDRKAATETAGLIYDDRILTSTLGSMPKARKPAPGAPGGSQADFDPLIDLIKSTVGPPTIWDDMGGQGTVIGFEGGVYVDPQGVLKPAAKEDLSGKLTELRRMAASATSNDDIRRSSTLRKVSLRRLERQVQLRAALGQPPTLEMQTLAGMQRVKYVLAYPQEGDIVLAGPAGDWSFSPEGRFVSAETRRPVLRLDDFVVVLRQMMSAGDARFGCSITPRQAALAGVQAYLIETGKKPLRPGQRQDWIKGLRDRLGQQDIEVNGVDPRTRVARVLVEADYRMKLVGMGLEDGVLDVPSYLEMIKLKPGQAPPPMDVLRWWFTINYEAIVASPERDAFELRGQGVKVLSENELLTAIGQRVHTGDANPLNEQFARNFTQHFAELAVKYPIYAELQNIFDLALIAALIRQEGLAEKADWHLTYFGDRNGYPITLSAAPKTVDTVINHRVIDGATIVVGVSGGVRVDPNALVTPLAIHASNDHALKTQRASAAPGGDMGRWWWD